jgi:hypothetical protein
MRAAALTLVWVVTMEHKKRSACDEAYESVLSGFAPKEVMK